MKNSIPFLFLLTFTMHAHEGWIDPSNGAIEHVYIGAPGMLCSPAQFAKLTPRFTALTGETVRCDGGITMVPDNVIVPHLAEISPRRSLQHETLSCIGKAFTTVPLCALGLLLKAQYAPDSTLASVVTGVSLVGCMAYTLWRPLNFVASAASHKKFGIKIEGKPHGIESIAQHAIDPFKINVAQDDDVNVYLATYKKAIYTDTQKKKKAILYGISRGSATVFESAALLDDQGASETIGAVVCEGIFDAVPNIIEHASCMQRATLRALMASRITRFKKDGMSPLSMLMYITDKDMPLALITSKSDREVPYENTFNLYKKLREQGHRNAHILVLETAGHNGYSLGAEKETYQAFMHAFYRKYDLPYREKFADAGVSYLAASQPEMVNRR